MSNIDFENKKNQLTTYLPVLVTMISGIFAFYSGMTSKIYYLGYFQVFSVSSSFVTSNMGFPNSTLILIHLDFIILALCLILFTSKADQVMNQYNAIKRIININTPHRLKGVLLGRVIKSVCNNCWTTVICVLMLLAIDYLYIFKFSLRYALFRIVLSFVFIVLIALMFLLFHFILIEVKIVISKHKNGQFQDVKGINKFIIEIIFVFSLEIVFMLIGSYLLGRGDALYNKEFCMTMDDEFIVIPVSDNRYATFKAVEKGDELVVLTDTVMFLENSIPVHFKKYKNTYIFDHEKQQIVDPVCEFLYYSSFEP